MTGEWPTEELDHIDLDKSNNRWGNLREASRKENSANVRVRTDSKTGVKGIRWRRNERKWHARIQVDGIRLHLGLFDTVAAATLAYKAAAEKYFGQFARTA